MDDRKSVYGIGHGSLRRRISRMSSQEVPCFKNSRRPRGPKARTNTPPPRTALKSGMRAADEGSAQVLEKQGSAGADETVPRAQRAETLRIPIPPPAG